MIQYYANADMNGNIIAYYNDDVWDIAKIPTTAIKITEAQWQDAIENQGKYIVQNGAFALAPPPTAAQQLATAQTNKIAQLQATRDNVLYGGFASSADGTARTYPSDEKTQDNIHKQTTAMLANVAVWPQPWEDATGYWTSFTQSQFQTFITDFNSFAHQQWTKYQSRYNQVKAATDLTTVGAIQW